MIGSSPFVESLWLVVANLETHLIVSIVFPAIVIGIGIKFMRNLDKN
jgi:hypothetical protein